jgi:hypothetical protein
MDPNEAEIVVPEATEVEQVIPEITEVPAEAKVDAVPEEKPEEKAAKEERKRGFQERINVITRQKREAEERANTAETRYQSLLKEIKEKPLSREQFSTDGEFEAELHARSGRMAAVEFQRTIAAEASSSQSAEHKNAVDAGWNEAVAEAMARIPDWHQVVSSDRGPTTPVMLEQIKESDNGPDIAYYLAKHPGEAQRIAGLSIPAQIREVARLEARLENGTPTRPSAPPPIKPITVAAKPVLSPKEEYAQWEAAQNKRLGYI